MRRLVNLVILLSAFGVFLTGFMFLFASSSHKEAERLRQHGVYSEITVVDKQTSSGPEASSYYVYVRSANQEASAPPIRCELVYPAYEKLHVGQRLQAWVLGSEALLDDGPKNAGSLSNMSLAACAGFLVVLTGALILKSVYHTRRFPIQLPPSPMDEPAEKHEPTGIPTQPLLVEHSSGGVGLHRRGPVYRQEASYSHLCVAGGLLVGAVVFVCLPWSSEATPGGPLKYWIAGIFVWACLCSVVVYLVRNAWGQNVTVDPTNRTLSIAGSGFHVKLSWEQILGLQICRRKTRENPEMNGFQLNLVCVGAGQGVMRHCLLQDLTKKLPLHLGRRYEKLFGFPLTDHTEKSASYTRGNNKQPARRETNQRVVGTNP